MGDWWIDESPYPGPYKEPTFGELFADTFSSSSKTLTTVAEAILTGGRQINKALKAAEYQSNYVLCPPVIYDEINKDELKDAFRKANAAANVPDGTLEKLTKEHGALSERAAKKYIGRGNVQGHGPRSGSTFGHNGRKRY